MHTRAPLDNSQDMAQPDAHSAFESALRRDLASAPLVAYESRVGGLIKRVFDLTLTLFFLPVWIPVLLGAALASKVRGTERVFFAEERVGYGGHVFQLYGVRLHQPHANIRPLREAVVDLNHIVRLAGDDSKWRRMLTRLPQLLNVLRGDMSLVGPAPLTREAVDALKSPKRFYLSARPGVIGLGGLGVDERDGANLHRAYLQTWSLTHDLLIMWDALNGFRNRGRLWKPGRTRQDRIRIDATEP